MHVILKPFIKLLIAVVAVLGIAQIAGIDVEELLNKLMGYINGGDATDTDATPSDAE